MTQLSVLSALAQMPTLPLALMGVARAIYRVTFLFDLDA